MTCIKELQARIAQANELLKKKLPPRDRLRVAGLKLLDQKRIEIRKKVPELDHPKVTEH